MQVHATIPDDAWEYHIRKSLNDAAYKGLDYVPYNTTMPLTPQSDNVKFIWVSSGPTLQRRTPDHEAHASLLSHNPYRVDESDHPRAGRRGRKGPIDGRFAAWQHA